MFFGWGRAGSPRSLVVAFFLTLAGLVFMGLPGALILEAAGPVIDAVFGRGAMDRLHTLALWPAALYLSLTWPLSLVAGECLVASSGLQGPSRVLLFTAVGALTCLLFAIGVFLLTDDA